MAARVAAVAAALVTASLGSPHASTCEFQLEPLFPNYFWDPSCKPGMLGCLADGKNVECRFCGGTGSYAGIPCRSDSCTFVNEPFVPYFWDPNCTLGQLGCWADGVHKECRFCGKFPYTSIACPSDVGGEVAAACTFENEPTAKYGWDPSCRAGMLGCLADGVHEGCRYCEEGPYSQISCAQNAAQKKCTFVNEPTVPYFWDSTCTVGQLGCLADGIHAECRFCAHRPFESIPCPGAPPATSECTFPPLRTEPKVPYYWEPKCAMGVLGCWADGLHAQCRYCGSGVYSGIACPVNATFPSGYTGTAVAALGTAAAQASESAQQSGHAAAQAPTGTLEVSAAAASVGAARPAAGAPDAKPAMDVKPAGETQVNGAPGQGRAALPLALGAAAAAVIGRGGL